MPVFFIGDKKVTVTMPEREIVKQIRDSIRLLHTENPTRVADGKLVAATQDQERAYFDKCMDNAYKTAELCGAVFDDPVYQEKVGQLIEVYIMSGPTESRPISIDEATRMAGTILLQDGSITEKGEAIRELFDTIAEHQRKLKKLMMSEGDQNLDPTISQT